MRPRQIGWLSLVLAACEQLPTKIEQPQLQPFRATTEVWSGGKIVLTSAAWTAPAVLPQVLLDEQPLDVHRIDDTTIAAAVADAPGPHVLRVIAPAVDRQSVVVHLRGFVERIEGPLLSGRTEAGRDPRYVFGNGPTSLRRWNVATNKAVDLGDTVHAVSCTGGVGPGPAVGDVVLLTGGCVSGRWMLWHTEPLYPLPDTTSVLSVRFVAVLSAGRWVAVDGQNFSVHACDGASCTSELISGTLSRDVVRSPRGDRAALLSRVLGDSGTAGVPVVDVALGKVGYRVAALSAAHGAAFSSGGDTLYLAGDSLAAFALVAIRASDGAVLTARRLDYEPCAVASDPVAPWVYVAGLSQASGRSLLQVFDRGTMDLITTLRVTSAIAYGDRSRLCRIMPNPIEHRVYVVDTWAGEHNPAAHAQLYSFETPR